MGDLDSSRGDGDCDRLMGAIGEDKGEDAAGGDVESVVSSGSATCLIRSFRGFFFRMDALENVYPSSMMIAGVSI
jgi:hypothetical protein